MPPRRLGDRCLGHRHQETCDVSDDMAKIAASIPDDVTTSVGGGVN